jgi:hypothetical protein
MIILLMARARVILRSFRGAQGKGLVSARFPAKAIWVVAIHATLFLV